MARRLLIIQAAALGWDLVRDVAGFRPAGAVFPAVTCTAQASFRTAAPPGAHGLVANGLYFPELRKVLFWEQSSALVEGPRIWDGFRARGGSVGMMFWQQSMGESVDVVASPAPIHKHSGGMIQALYTQPPELEGRLAEAVGRPFNLMNYWGPLANHKSSDWIVAATCAQLADERSPEVLFSYIPHLDYDLQRFGPQSREAKKAVEVFLGYLTQIKAACAEHGWDYLVLGDYAIEQVTGGAVFPNRALREAGLFLTREIAGMAYTDFHTSGAFAVVDHQVAHVYCRDAVSARRAAEVLRGLPGVAAVYDAAEQEKRGLHHRRGGALMIEAERGAWFAYPWFERKEAPDYAGHVDIHNKPGYDPCELFFGWPPGSVSFDTTRIHGTHGCVGQGMEIAWTSSLALDAEPADQLDLARAAQRWMEQAR